jgi:hypothetical protein
MCDCKISEAKRLRSIRAYQSYLNALRYAHESSFIQDDSDIGPDSQNIQLSVHIEIEIVEDVINQLKGKHFKDIF